MDTYIDLFYVRQDHLTLISSPEFHMKRLLAKGARRIFQITRSYRIEEIGYLHNPEFTILEFYERDRDYLWLIDTMKELIRFVGENLKVNELRLADGSASYIDKEWKITRFKDLVEGYGASFWGPKEELFMTMAQAETGLGHPEPEFLIDFPPSMASLAYIDERNIAQRVELYISGVELANGFTELTDPDEQLERFINEIKELEDMGKELPPIDTNFIAAMKELPPSAGIAVGIDRLVALFYHARDIHECMSFSFKHGAP